MTEAIKTTKTHPVPQVPAPEDLSAAIEQAMDKQRDEQVRCVRVFEDRYRCNWWVWDKLSSPIFLRTGTIRKSRFLQVTKAASELVIEDLTDRH